MDAKTYYREGVLAIRDQGDRSRGRALLLKSLELAPHNDMAWLWLTRTVDDARQKLQYVERALQINPQNEPAQQLHARLVPTNGAAQIPAHTPDRAAPDQADRPSPYKTVADPVTRAEREHIARLMQQAEIHLEAGEIEAAVEQWVRVLSIRVDHETALRNAVGHLWKLGYQDDAAELVQRAVDARTGVPTILLTAIDIAERQGRRADAETLRNRIARLPDTEDEVLLKIANGYADNYRIEEAIAFLKTALETHPRSQALMIRLGDLYLDFNQHQNAMQCYDQAVRAGANSKAGKDADQRLANFVPVLTDRERGSVSLALREMLGIAIFYLLLGWQDAGLDIFSLGFERWLGVLFSLLGGYLLVTATSSPQQRPLAGWLGGRVPPKPAESETLNLLQEQHAHTAPGRALAEPSDIPLLHDEMRQALGVAGALLLAMAFYLVLHRAIDIVIDSPPPYWLW